MTDLFTSTLSKKDWWEYDPEGLLEKIDLLRKLKKTAAEKARTHSRDKASKDSLRRFRIDNKKP